MLTPLHHGAKRPHTGTVPRPQAATADIVAQPWAAIFCSFCALGGGIIQPFCSWTDLSALGAASKAIAKGDEVHRSLRLRRSMAAVINAAAQHLVCCSYSTRCVRSACGECPLCDYLDWDREIFSAAQDLGSSGPWILDWILWTFDCVRVFAEELWRPPVRKHTLHDVPRMLETKFPLMLDTSGVLFCSWPRELRVVR